MGDQAAVTVDPNLIVNSMHTGATDAWNYGPQAVEARGATINATNVQSDALAAQSDYQYGTEARDLRQQANDRNNAATNFEYGITAQQGQAADVSLKLVNNDFKNLEYVKRKMESEKLDQITVDNEAILAQNTNQRLQKESAFFQSPDGQHFLQQTVEGSASLQGNQLAASVEESKAKLAAGQFTTTKTVADARSSAAESTQKADQYDRYIELHDILTKADQLDSLALKNGVVKPTNVINAASSAILGKWQAVQENPELVKNALANINPDDLPVEVQQKYDQINNAATYHLAGKMLPAAISNIASRASSGQGSAVDTSLSADMSTIGINAMDPQDVLGMGITKVQGGFQLSNPTTGLKSRVYTDEEYASNPDFQSAYLQSLKRSATSSNNPATQFGNSQKVLKSIYNGQLGKQFGDSAQGIIQSAVGGDQEKISQQAVNIQLGLQTQVLGANTWLSDIQAADGQETGINIFGDISKTNPIQEIAGYGKDEYATPQEYQDNLRASSSKLVQKYASPAYAENIINSFHNRATGGVDRAVLEASVQDHVDNIIRNTPAYSKLKGLARANIERTVRNNVLANMVVPISDDSFRNVLPLVIKAHPQFNTPDVQAFLSGQPEYMNDTSLNFVSRSLMSIRDLINGPSVATDIERSSKTAGEVLGNP